MLDAILATARARRATAASEQPPAEQAVVEAGEGFDTGIFSDGQSRSETFNEAGTFAYICTPLPQMNGTVIVQAAVAAQGHDDERSSETGASSGSGSGSDDAGGALVLGLVALGLGALLRRRPAATG